jgi:hypothetical protein
MNSTEQKLLWPIIGRNEMDGRCSTSERTILTFIQGNRVYGCIMDSPGLEQDRMAT